MNSSITLSGNLGERHRCLNALVQDAYLQNIPFVQTHPEEPALDRLFKIDLASKQKNVEFIIHTLKGDDMLYVSRALKSLWLLDPVHSNIINPSFLEHELFPHMKLTAANKMRHWIQMHLRDPQRCKEFYQFYRERNFDMAAKFLWHCSNQCILDEISNVLDKITPKLLKRLSEKVPGATKIYYEELRHNRTLLKDYLKNDLKFFSNIKYLIKTDAAIFFYVLENFFVPRKFGSFNAVITKYIMKYHRCRFEQKPELYTAWFLHMGTLARCLNSEEIKELIVKLASAEYLKSWFSYQNVEPLIKRITAEERTAFKTLVFVQKDFGPMVKEWPYPIPNPPKLETVQTSIFDDFQIGEHQRNHRDRNSDYDSYDHRDEDLRKKKCKRALLKLDDLFDKYRFCNYKETYEELRKEIEAESSPTNRQSMLLVLVSKTGGRTKDLISLLDYLVQHRNEPVHIRAAIVRSLVKRAFVWRLPPDHWARLLKWGHGLGLDGGAAGAECCEGLHAVVIRDLLAGVKPCEPVWKKFIAPTLGYFNRETPTLQEYSLTPVERKCVGIRLPALLLAEAQSNTKDDVEKMSQLLCVLDIIAVYCNRFDQYPEVVETVFEIAKINWFTSHRGRYWEAGRAKELLTQLYNAGFKRKSLTREYFDIIQTDASYINALRHDISLLDNTKHFEKILNNNEVKHPNFFRKLGIYFMEKGGLGERHYAVVEHRAATARKKTIIPESMMDNGYQVKRAMQKGLKPLARPLVLLSGPSFLALLKKYDEAPKRTFQRQLATALRSVAHLVRPAFDLESFGWRNAGVKAAANQVATCREGEVERYLAQTLTWKRTLRLSLVLAKRVNKEHDVFTILASERPRAALQAALLYIRREGENSDPRIWDMVKSRISKTDHEDKKTVNHFFLFYNEFTKSVPAIFKAEYCFLFHMWTKKDSGYTHDIHSQVTTLSYISALVPELNEQSIFDIVNDFLRDFFTDYTKFNEFVNAKNVKAYNNYYINEKVIAIKRIEYIYLFIEIIAKFLVLNISKEILDEKLEKIATPFLNSLESFWKQGYPKDEIVEKILDTFLFYLRYNKAYLDVKYVSCLPVFERIKEWMHGFLPIEKWFGKHLTVHLTAIYYRAVRLSSENPRLSLEESNKSRDSQEFGENFGKLVSDEIQDLIQKYFPSITELYAPELVNYINEYIYRSNCQSFEHFAMGLLNALLIRKSVGSCVLAKYLLDDLDVVFKSYYVKHTLKQFNESEFKELRIELD